MSIFINTAMAAEQAATTAGASPEHAQASGISTLIFLGIFFVIFYFVFIRPQSKRAKDQRRMIDALAKGDEVITVGGLAGRITQLNDNFIVLEIAKGVEVTVQKVAISSSLPKGTLKQS